VDRSQAAILRTKGSRNAPSSSREKPRGWATDPSTNGYARGNSPRKKICVLNGPDDPTRILADWIFRLALFRNRPIKSPAHHDSHIWTQDTNIFLLKDEVHFLKGPVEALDSCFQFILRNKRPVNLPVVLRLGGPRPAPFQRCDERKAYPSNVNRSIQISSPFIRVLGFVHIILELKALATTAAGSHSKA
jgi:hypothetical protein